MERRKAFATAGAVSVTALALVVALGANVGLFGLTRHDDGPGRFKLVGSTQSRGPNVRTEIVDVPVPAAPAPGGGSSSGRSSSSSSSASPSAVAPAGTSAPSATSSSGGQPTSDDHEAERPESGDEDD